MTAPQHLGAPAPGPTGPPRARRERRGAGRSRGLSHRRVWRPWLLLAPALLTLGGLLLVPLVRVVDLSFQDYGLRELNQGLSNYVGWDNYARVFADPLVRTALTNTVVFAAVAVSLTVVFGTLVALLLARLGPWLRGAVTTAILVAWAMPAVTGTYVWVYLFDASNGPVVRGLVALGLADPGTTNWFADRLSFYAIVVLNVVHHGFPFVAVTVLAALMTLPREMTEAAMIDGANAWQRFWHVTFPTLKPVFAVVTILSTIWDFKVFAQVYLMPGGSGANREVLNLGTWSYVTGISQKQFGLGSTIAVLLTVLLLVVTAVYLRVLFKEDDDL